MRRISVSASAVAAVLAAGLVAAGCGGKKSAATATATTGTSTTSSSTASTSTATTTTPKPPRLHPLGLRVIDGDTGKAVPGLRILAKRVVRHGPRLFVRSAKRPVTVTLKAPHYDTRTLQVTPGAGTTVELYRPDGQWLMYGVDPARTQSDAGIHIHPPFKVVWGRNLHALLEFPAVVDDGMAYLSNLDGTLFALSMKTGKTQWQLDMQSHEQDSSPAIFGPNLLVAHSKEGRVMVVRRSDGHVVWDWHAGGLIESSPVIIDGIDYLGDWSGDIYALDLHTRQLKWSYRDGCKITASATINGNAVTFGDYCGRVVTLDRRTGAVLWSRSVGGAIYGTSATADGRIFVPSRGSEALYALDDNGGYLWHVQTGGLVYSAPAVWDGRVYFGSYTGTLYCVSASSGSVLWTVQTGGEISGSPTVVDGIVYTGTFSHRIVGVDARTGHELFSFPHGEYVATSGNSGRLLLYGWSELWAVEPKRA